MSEYTPRERFIAAMERRPIPGRVPHFELVFFLTMEAFGKVHPSHRRYSQWTQMSSAEQQLHRGDMAQLFIDTAERFEHDAIFLHPNPSDLEESMRMVDEVRERSGDRYFLMLHGDATYSIPDGAQMEEMSLRMAEEPEAVDAQAVAATDDMIQRAERLQRHGGLDGFALCSDYCFNTGPFLSPEWFDRFVTPHLARQIAAYREMGFYTIKHTDGNIMPILDSLVGANPHALHSIDPQAGMDIGKLAELVGDRVALCGNVDCGKLQTGTDADCVESARNALECGMRAPGYVFCTSNCVYTGMELARYELILDVWRKEGIRGEKTRMSNVEIRNKSE